VQVANPFAHLIEQLDGPGRYPVRFVRSVIPVHTSSMMLYRIDFKHFFWVPCDFVQRSRLWVSGVWSDKPQVGRRLHIREIKIARTHPPESGSRRTPQLKYIKMNKKDRIAVVLSILYLFLPLSIVGGGGEGPEIALGMVAVLVAYWGYRFIKG